MLVFYLIFMGEIFEEKCGICLTHTLNDCYDFMRALQHRGRDSAGIAAKTDGRIDVIKWEGSVDKITRSKLANLFKEIDNREYHTFMGHVRYATRGKNEVLQDAHPVCVGGNEIDNGSHRFMLDCDAVGLHNGQISIDDILKDIETSYDELDTKALMEFTLKYGADEIIDNIAGSYTFIFTSKDSLNVDLLRDKHGMMPGVLGEKDRKYVFASEDIALRKNHADIVKDLEPGSFYEFRSDGRMRKKHQSESESQHCFFQWNYIAHAQSTLEKTGVWSLRRRLGEKLAQHITPDLDIVTYLPDCPRTAADSYAEYLGKPFKEVFYKLREERSFQGPDKEERKSSIRQNLYVTPIIDGIPAEKFLAERSIGIIDDSIIRGNNAKHARDLLLDMGVSDIHMISYTPPVGIIGKDSVKRGCTFGIDMPPDDEFIARERTLEEISEKMGMHVHYLAYEAMLEAFREEGLDPEKLCTYCIGGKHPFTSYR